MNKRIRIVIAVTVVLVIGICFGTRAYLLRDDSERALPAAELVDLGEKYLLEMDYEQAVVYFTKLIEVEPMNPHGYTGMAEAYVGSGREEDTIAVLEQGFALTGDNKIHYSLEELKDTGETDVPAIHEEETEVLLSKEQMVFLENLESALLEMDSETTFQLMTSHKFTEICEKITDETVYKVDSTGEWYMKPSRKLRLLAGRPCVPAGASREPITSIPPVNT